jgi:hypothetical protein
MEPRGRRRRSARANGGLCHVQQIEHRGDSTLPFSFIQFSLSAFYVARQAPVKILRIGVSLQMRSLLVGQPAKELQNIFT